ncbi:MAG: PDZ domain-containing protein, partial [Alphaproteobacteria bacterium]|nr:PDZ domain-containing protein [Alphaproteobacteria bacterium]
EIIMLSRQAWIGSHLINVAVWSGDIDSSWEELLKQIKVAQNVALSGIYWWTTDIGGYRPVGLDDNEFQELILRWFQFGAFCPLFRLHGYRHPPLPDNECGSSGGHNEIWLFNYSSQIIDIILLRESLRDYVEYHLNISHENGTPILRPMFYDFSDDSECYKAEDQYMFGSDYLVAPVYTYRATSRSVYLPAISKHNLVWQHYYTKQFYAGGQRYNIPKTVDGTLISKIERGSVASQQGLQVGDIIVQIGQTKVTSPREANRLIDTVKENKGSSVLFLINRQGNNIFVALKIDKV